MTRVALVTGASRNIGRATAVALAKRGYQVACLGRDKSALEQTVELVKELGGSASLYVGDVSNDADINDYVEQTIASFGSIDVVVNNAGVMREASVEETSPEQFRAIIDTNLTAAFVLSKSAYPYLKRAGGVIVNIGSMFGALGVPRAASYCSSKAGMEGLTRALAAEWARDGIRVVCIAPGYVRSDISSAVLDDPAMAKAILSRIPMRRAAEPEEIGDFIAFLLSDQARFVTGETFVIDGGQRMSV